MYTFADIIGFERQSSQHTYYCIFTAPPVYDQFGAKNVFSCRDGSSQGHRRVQVREQVFTSY
jgi:hypothetical protein